MTTTTPLFELPPDPPIPPDAIEDIPVINPEPNPEDAPKPPDTTDLFATPPKSDKYRKGSPPVFDESNKKYYQDELTKIERVMDLAYDDVHKTAEDGAKLRASFSEEVTIRVTEDEAISRRITQLKAAVDTDRRNTSAYIKIEQTARATREEALAQQLITLDAKLTQGDLVLDAKVTQEQLARVTKDEAIAKDVTTLTATVNSNNVALSASINSEAQARVNADGALSSKIDTLTTKVGDNAASIATEISARTSGDSANAQAITNLSTTVSGHTTTIGTISQTVDGLSAKWGVKINNNGRVAGVSLNSDKTGYSNFDIEANAFTIYSPGTTNKMIYWDGSTLVVKGDITANKITAQAVNTLPDNTINRPLLAKPNILGSGTYFTNSQQFRSGGYRVVVDTENGSSYNEPVPITIFIPTGLYIESGWTNAPTNVYAATAIMSGSGSCSGYASAIVLIGDGSMSDANSTKGQIYIRYNWEPANGSGTLTVNSIAWKIVQI